MSRLTRRWRRLAVAAAGLVAACAVALPAASAHAAADGYSPGPNEWWMQNWAVPQKVWPATQGEGVTVGVIGTGVQATVPDLRGVVKPGGDMINAGGNGETDYGPNDGHDTAVAALIAGQGSGPGVVGIAPKAKILPVHVLYPTSGLAPIAEGIKYAVDHGASVINLSIGVTVVSATTCYPPIQEAVAYALAHNVVVVAAAGDVSQSGPGPEEPATCAGVLAVGGVEKDGSPWSGGVRGSNIAVGAPGDFMVDAGRDGRYSHFTAGTSYSAPLVAGAAALIRSKYPSMPWYTVVQRLIGTAIPDGAVPNTATGYGIIDVNHAVNASAYPVKVSAPNPVYARYLAWLKTPDGQAFAQANRIGTGQGQGGQPAPSSAKSSSGGSSTLIIALIVVLVVAAGAGIAFVQISRKRIRRGPPGGYGPPPGGGYGPPPSQYPQQGQGKR